MSRDVEDLNRRLLRARDAMDRAYAEPLDVRAIAAVAHISAAHFSRCFRDVFGVGAILYEVLTQIPPYYAQSLGDLVLQAQSGSWRPPQEVNGPDLV